MEEFHTSVLLQEVIEGLNVKPGKKYIDATLGGGGHGVEIVKRGGKVLGIDTDEEAIEHVKKILSEKDNITLVRGNFRDIGEIARAHGFEKVAGVLFDLGVSSHQLTAKERGFSFQKDGPLDMRMHPKEGFATAADLVNGLYEHELTSLFEKYGEDRMARRIARAICVAREVARIETTAELARIIERVVGRRVFGGKKSIHPATKVFQALRIAVNDELGSLEAALPKAVELLDDKGRIAVISFHSLEDRIVKNFFREHSLAKKPIAPTDEEIARNPKARSGKLRIYEKNLS